MKKNLLSILSSLAVCVLLFVSCAKDGPAGATGPAGAPGPTGPAGPAGATGPVGTANVTYSAWLDVGFGIDTILTINGVKDTFYVGSIEAPKLTSAMLTNGELKVYLNANSAANPAIFPLPYVDPTNGEYIQPVFFPGGIQLNATDNYGTYQLNNVKYFQYRYILIPGGVPARSSINWNDYNEVKAALNLPD